MAAVADTQGPAMHGQALASTGRVKPAFLPLVCLVIVAAILGGCYHDVQILRAQKVGPGHCLVPGVIEVAIVGFEAKPNATVDIRIGNRFGGLLDYEPTLYIRTTGGHSLYRGFLRNESWPLVPYEGLQDGESRVERVKLGPVANVTWHEMSFYFTYGPSKNRSEIQCRLDGDNAPWAFETKESRPSRGQNDLDG